LHADCFPAQSIGAGITADTARFVVGYFAPVLRQYRRLHSNSARMIDWFSNLLALHIEIRLRSVFLRHAGNPAMRFQGTESLGPEAVRVSTKPKAAAVTFLERYSLLLCLLLVGIAFVRIISTYSALSVTQDEPFHLACAIEYFSYHTMTLDVENPPLAHAVEGLGPYLAGARLTGRTDPFLEGPDILARSGNVGGMMFRFRLGTLPFFLLACCAVGLFSLHFFGKAAAVLAVALYTFLPTTLADAGLGTTDMALASTTTAAFLAAICWAEKPNWKRAIVTGFFIALALLTKLTSIGFLGCSLFLAAVAYWCASGIGGQDIVPITRRYYKTFGLIVVSTLLSMWAAYWFSFGPISGHRIFVPAPEYFEGIRAAINHNRGGHMGYLLGHHRTTGWWYFFPVALSVKTPIAFLILVAVGAVVCFRRRASVRYMLPFAFVAGVMVPSMSGHINIGIRHIAPVYLGLSIIAALGLMQLLESDRFRLAFSWSAVALVVWMIVSVAVQHPDYLGYFNAFAGKHPENVLVDSSYDWGQDLKLLSARLQQLKADHITLASLDGAQRDSYRQAWYGLPPIVDLDDEKPNPGWTAVSASYDKSYRFFLRRTSKLPTPWYEKIAPTERLGPYFLYYIPPANDTAWHDSTQPQAESPRQ
jgi:hypothetical protein